MDDIEPHIYPRQDELGLLGACLLGGVDTAVDVIASVPADAIFADDIRGTYAIIERLATHGSACDQSAVLREWQRIHDGTPAPLALWGSAMDACPSPANAGFFAQGVIDGWRRRRVIEGGAVLSSRARDAGVTVDEAMAEAEAVLSGNEAATVDIMSGKQAALQCIADLQARHDRQGAIGGIETGLSGFDRMADGLQPGEQCVIAARPSIGKTAISLAILEHACLRNNVPSLFVTLEMSPASLMRRMASSWAKIPMNTLRLGQFDQNQYQRLTAYTVACSKAPLHVLDGVSGLTVAAIAAAVRRAVRKHGVKLVIVDYLQKVSPTTKHEKRTYEVAEVSQKLKAVAAKTGVAMLTLAQLNRESEKDKRAPRLSDLADSGQIERDADLVALLHRDRGGENAHDASLIVAKQRDGETGSIKIHFDGRYCKFTGITESHND